jgi:hypothetical protein
MKIPLENTWTLTQMKGKACENPKETLQRRTHLMKSQFGNWEQKEQHNKTRLEFKQHC